MRMCCGVAGMGDGGAERRARARARRRRRVGAAVQPERAAVRRRGAGRCARRLRHHTQHRQLHTAPRLRLRQHVRLLRLLL